MNINLAKIEGSLTILINQHLRNSEGGYKLSKVFAEQLEDLLEMVVDMQGKDEKYPIKVLVDYEENERLRKRILELEETCENMNEIEINLSKKIEKLEEENQNLKRGMLVL